MADKKWWDIGALWVFLELTLLPYPCPSPDISALCYPHTMYPMILPHWAMTFLQATDNTPYLWPGFVTPGGGGGTLGY